MNFISAETSIKMQMLSAISTNTPEHIASVIRGGLTEVLIKIMDRETYQIL